MAETIQRPPSWAEFRRIHPELNGKEAEGAWNAWLDAYLRQQKIRQDRVN